MVQGGGKIYTRLSNDCLLQSLKRVQEGIYPRDSFGAVAEQALCDSRNSSW